jgi:GT2 family glycosyltransferase
VSKIKSNDVYTVIIPVFNRIMFTRKCLHSLYNQTYKDFNIIVIDDGSTDGTNEMLSIDFPEVIVLQGDGNLWWTGAMNKGVEWVMKNLPDAKYIITMNNDVLLPKEYMENVRKETEAHPNCLIGSLTLDAENRDSIVEAGVSISWIAAKYKYNLINTKISELNLSKSRYYVPTVLSGRGATIPIEVFQRIGLYDRKVFPHYGADYDMSLRAQYAGFKLLTSYQIRLYSYPKMSGLGNTEDKISIKDALYSLGSIRSGNNLPMRIRFGFRHAPNYLLPIYLILDLARVIVSALFMRTMVIKCKSK